MFEQEKTLLGSKDASDALISHCVRNMVLLCPPQNAVGCQWDECQDF